MWLFPPGSRRPGFGNRRSEKKLALGWHILLTACCDDSFSFGMNTAVGEFLLARLQCSVSPCCSATAHLVFPPPGERGGRPTRLFRLRTVEPAQPAETGNRADETRPNDHEDDVLSASAVSADTRADTPAGDDWGEV